MVSRGGEARAREEARVGREEGGACLGGRAGGLSIVG